MTHRTNGPGDIDPRDVIVSGLHAAPLNFDFRILGLGTTGEYSPPHPSAAGHTLAAIPSISPLPDLRLRCVNDQESEVTGQNYLRHALESAL